MHTNPDLVKSNPHNFISIQVFRFIAAFMVIVCHSSFYTFERLTKEVNIYREGANGVSLFFVISGFVMIISSEHLIHTANGWKIFAVKRLIRIVPVYWLITACKLLLMLVAAGFVYHAQLDVWLILKSFFFIPALNVDREFRPVYGVGWTLNLELFFYLLFALSLALKIRPIPFLAFIFIPLAILSYYKTPGWLAIGFYAEPLVLNFLYGMMAAKLIVKGKKIPAILSILLIVLGLLYLFIPGIDLFGDGYEARTLTAGAASFFVIYSGASIDRLFKAKVPAWLIYLGGASYSLYLVHPGIAPLIPTILDKINLKIPFLSVALSVMVATIAGVVFYSYLEKPITKLLTKKMKKFET